MPSLARVVSPALALALLVIGGCRCGVEEPTPAEDEDPPDEPTLTLDRRPRAPSEPTALVIADVATLEATDLSKVETLDLAMSELDGQERPLPLPEPEPEPPPETSTGEPGPARPNNPRCEGLDLHAVAERAPKLRALRISGCQAAVHAGLSAFGERLEELELVDLELDAVTVARLSQLHGLNHLAFTRVHAEPDALKPLARKISPRSVTLRELERESPLAEIFGILRDVRVIRIVGKWPTHKTMINVGKARKLEHLAMINTGIGNYSLRQVQHHDHLSKLEWSGSGINNMSPITLRELPITEFVCDCPRFGDNGLRQLYLFEGLERLELGRSDVSSAGLAHLSPLTALADITLRYVDLDGEGFAALATLPKLQRLILGPGKLEDPKASSLGELIHLRELEMQLEGFGDAAAPQLATLVELERLDLSGSKLSDVGLEHLAPLTKLRELELHHTRITKHGLEHLGGMRQLTVLELDHTDLVDEGVAYLAELHSLRDLRLDHTLITDAALPHLLGLVELERLNLAHTVVTVEGAAMLAKLPKLEAVNLDGTRAVEG